MIETFKRGQHPNSADLVLYWDIRGHRRPVGRSEHLETRAKQRNHLELPRDIRKRKVRRRKAATAARLCPRSVSDCSGGHFLLNWRPSTGNRGSIWASSPEAKQANVAQHRTFLTLSNLVFSLVVAGCSSYSATNNILISDAGAPAGGSTGAGGAPLGGASASLVGGSNTNAGASSTSAGASSVGGTAPNGGASPVGGAPLTGGAASTGGASSTGGAVDSGGATASGGSPPSGGVPASSSGGATLTGGAAPSGGSKPIGGAPMTGGAPAATGGAMTGGASNAGSTLGCETSSSLGSCTPDGGTPQAGPVYSLNRTNCPDNSLLGTQCVTTGGLCGTMQSKCATVPSTCGFLYCVGQ